MAKFRVDDYIRDVPDFPKKGIIFKDITPLLGDAEAFKKVCRKVVAKTREMNTKVDYVAGIESRGFIFGAPIAQALGVGFVPIRKPGKLPARCVRQTYQLEYGSDAIEMHADAFGNKKGARVLLVDDLLATGGTMAAACGLVEKVGGKVAAIAFVIELDFLHGRKKLKGRKLISLMHVGD